MEELFLSLCGIVDRETYKRVMEGEKGAFFAYLTKMSKIFPDKLRMYAIDEEARVARAVEFDYMGNKTLIIEEEYL